MCEDPSLHMKSEGRCCRSMFAGSKYELPSEFGCRLRECRGIYFPLSKCEFCRWGLGRALYCITNAGAASSIECYPNKQYVEDATALLSSHFQNGSPAWPIDAPIWRLAPHAAPRCHFTSKWMGQAFFVCTCRGKPTSVPSNFFGGYGIGIHGGPMYDKQVFYRCPYVGEFATAAEDDEEANYADALSFFPLSAGV